MTWICIGPTCHSSHYWSCSSIHRTCPLPILLATVRSPPPIRDRSWTDFGPLSLRSLAPPAVSNGTETLRAFVRRPTVHRDGLPLHERARRTLSWWKPRAGEKESSLARGKPRDQGASTHGWMPTSRTTRRCGSNELEVSWDAEEVADEDRKREMMRRWIY